MNVKEYISSGVLEAYVLDELSAAEKAEVENVVNQYPEVAAELESVEKAMEALAVATAIEPPAALQGRIRSELNLKDASDESVVVAMKSERTYDLWRFAAAASIVVALGSAIMAYNYWSLYREAENKLTDLIAQNQQFADNYNQVNQQLDDLASAVTVMNSSNYQRVLLNGTESFPDNQATVYWNAATSEVYLSVQNLKELSQDQQYQLWAIIDGKPVDAGVFDRSDSKLLLAMKSIGNGAAAFAVTIEPRGGSVDPTLETMQVVGEV